MIQKAVCRIWEAEKGRAPLAAFEQIWKAAGLIEARTQKAITRRPLSKRLSEYLIK